MSYLKCRILAGHCMLDKKSTYKRAADDIVLYFGVYNLKQRNEAGVKEVNVAKVIVHEQWLPLDENYDADIAILKLAEKVTFTEKIKPICLWPANDAKGIETGTVISWTEPEPTDPGYYNSEQNDTFNYPKTYIMPIRSYTRCTSAQRRFLEIASTRTFCGGGFDSGPCLEVGNSGASMAVEVEEKFYLRGIISASFIDIAGCDNYTFTLFTDVLRHKSWTIDLLSDKPNQL